MAPPSCCHSLLSAPCSLFTIFLILAVVFWLHYDIYLHCLYCGCTPHNTLFVYPPLTLTLCMFIKFGWLQACRKKTPSGSVSCDLGPFRHTRLTVYGCVLSAPRDSWGYQGFSRKWGKKLSFLRFFSAIKAWVMSDCEWNETGEYSGIELQSDNQP